MLLPRRKFLASSLFFGASAFFIVSNPRAGLAGTLADDGQLSPEALHDPVHGFTRETFELYVGGYFEAPGTRGEMVALKLLKVDSYEPHSDTRISARPAVPTNSFSLLFSAAAPLPRFASIHAMKHGALGEFNLFLTHKAGPNREIFYEAVFNRVR